MEQAMRGAPGLVSFYPLIPAKAGIQSRTRNIALPWIPAFAGMSGVGVFQPQKPAHPGESRGLGMVLLCSEGSCASATLDY